MRTDLNGYPDWSMMSLAVGLKHFENVYKWTSAVLDAIHRCELDEEYWMSTKGSGTVIVIHCEDHFFEGDCQTFALGVAKINNTEDFISLVEKSGMLKRNEYPWINFKGNDDA